MHKSKFLFHFLAFLTVAIWGVTFVSSKVLIAEGLEPSQIFFLRFLLAYAGMWLLAPVFRKNGVHLFAKSLVDELYMVLLGVTGGSFYFLLENTALKYTQASNVSFLVSSSPLVMLSLSLLVRRFMKGRMADGQEKVRVGGVFIAGTLMALAGIAMVVFVDSGVNISPKGDFMALGAALCWGVYSVLMGVVGSEYSSAFITRKVFFYGLLTIVPFLFFCPPVTVELLLRPAVWTNLLFLGVVASLACFVIWNEVMAKIGNVTSTNYVYLNPFFTLLFAVLLLGERLTPLSAAGSVLIVLGVIAAGKGASSGK